jgi:hypothetical protein
MSTRIDLSFTDERLLRDSKRRTAANQQALDDRTQTAKEQQAAEQAAEQATPEERLSGVPDLRLERRPSAQRRKKGFELFAVDYVPELEPPDGLVSPGTRETDSINWTAYTTTLQPKQWNSNYDISSLFWTPFFYSDTKNRTNLYSKIYEQELCVKQIEWTYNYESPFLSPQGRIRGLTPTLPFNLEDTRVVVPDSSPALVSCTETTIFVSNIVQISRPTDNIMRSARGDLSLYNPTAFDFYNQNTYTNYLSWPTYLEYRTDAPLVLGRRVYDKGGSKYDLYDKNVFNENRPPSQRLSTILRADVPYENVEYVGLYWKYNFKSKQGSFKAVSVHNTTLEYKYTSPTSIPNQFISVTPDFNFDDFTKIPLRNFFSALDPTDPNYSLWQEGKTGNTYPFNDNTYLFAFTEWKWPSNTVYNPKTGVVAAIVNQSNPILYTKQLSKNLSYVFVRTLLPAIRYDVGSYDAELSSFYEENGWTKESDPIVNSVKSAHYNFVVPT